LYYLQPEGENSMSDFKLTRSVWKENTYNYLSKEDSILYDHTDNEDVKRLIFEKARGCYGAYCRQSR
jgi:hypothetical protein